MKKYRLKQWYPSLKQDWSKGDIAEWFDGYYWNKGKVILNGLSKNEVENNPDFWELIEEEKYCNCPIPTQLPGGLLCFKCQQFIRKDKEPLFITDDGVECFDGDEYISIGNYYNKIYMIACNCDAPYSSDVKRFKHESNADEYIWRNKPLLSVKDVVDNCENLSYAENIELIELAKERIEQ